ncbi:hypothetical protein MMC11_000944 [Xylographa trunciseda]|nr:hypothetical protein [Xylographa trunciseda]
MVQRRAGFGEIMLQRRSGMQKINGNLRPSATVVPEPLRGPRTPIGTFSKLPFEVRCVIWKYMLEPCVKLAILRTSKQLHEEIAAEIYRDQTLEIEIDASESRWSHEATFARCDRHAGTVAQGYDKWFRILDDADWARFKNILITIYPDLLADPGYLLVVRNNVVDLVNRIQKSPRIPSVRVEFWGGRGQWTTGFLFVTSDSIHRTRSDFEHLLKPFKLLRGVEFASAQPDGWDVWPGSTVMSDHYKLASETENLMMRKSVFGDEEIDAAILEEHHIMTIELDMALDRLPGKIAKMLRLSRFENWMAYEPEMHRLLHQVYPNLPKEYQDKALRALQFRTEAWVYFRSCVTIGPSESLDDAWWDAFPSGIPRKQSHPRGKPMSYTWENLIASKADAVAKGVHNYWNATHRFEDAPDTAGEGASTYSSDGVESLSLSPSKAEAPVKRALEEDESGETIVGGEKKKVKGSAWAAFSRL